MNINKLAASVILLAAGFAMLTSCDSSLKDSEGLTQAQKDLIGTGVNFDPHVEGLVTRAYNHDGFNYGDVMYIFRQGFDANGVYAPEEDWKSYKFNATIGLAGEILFAQWEINKDKNAGFRGTTQTDADSLFWENGKSVRFRAYAKSCLYEDYMYADYAGVSGPVTSVPLEFKHLGFRIGFRPKPGNTIVEVNYCTEPEDYMRIDNADSEEGADEADMMSEAEARATAAAVKAAFDLICVPGGIEMYSDADNNRYDRTSGADVAAPTARRGRLTAKSADGNGEVIAENVTVENTKRPDWKCDIDGIRYMMGIPYVMSGDQAGSPITIPAKARFRVRLKDLNTADAENQYHIFSLSDIRTADGTAPKYPDGITLRAGWSYVFSVGYQYGQLKVEFDEERTDWSMAGSVETGAGASPVEDNTPTYEWWRDAMNKAADNAMANEDGLFEPVFEIKNLKEWQEFTDVVNGNVPLPVGTDSSMCVVYRKFTPQNGTIPKYVETTYMLGSYDFAGFTVNLASDLCFSEREIVSVGNSADRRFRGSLKGNGHVISDFSGYIFGYTGKTYGKNAPIIEGLRLKSTHKIGLIREAGETKIMGISVEAPSDNAIAIRCTDCVIRACRHIGTGNANGPLIGGGSGNAVYGCYVAAAGRGILCGSASAAEFTGCFYDKTLSPVAGDNGVVSQVLKAVKDNMPDPLRPGQPEDTFYGEAPFKIMNEMKGEEAEAYVFKTAAHYDDRYPSLELN